MLEISAPSFGPAFSGNLSYAVGSDHGGYLFQAGFTPLGGYIQAVNGTTLSAIAWQSGGVSHHSVYAIGGDNGVYVSTDGGAFTALGGYALDISAGLDASGNPEVYAIGGDNSLFVNNGGGFVGLAATSSRSAAR